jgi:ribosomal protein S12 methylthiotransferase accessory factor
VADRSSRDARPAYLRLAHGLDVLDIDGGSVLLRSDTLSFRLEGPSARFFAERVLPLLDGSRSLDQVGAEAAEVDPADLEGWIGRLVGLGAVEVSGSPSSSRPTADRVLEPMRAMVAALGLPEQVMERLRGVRVAIVGLEGPGAHAAVALATSGVGRLTLVDPFPCTLADLALLPPGPVAVGTPREAVARRLLEALPTGTEVTAGSAEPLTRESLEQIVAGSDLLVGCFDKGFAASALWLNQIALARQVPAVFGRVAGHRSLVGPLVFPGEGPCYLCWRMRALACADDFEGAMAHEEHLDSQRRPALHQRPTLPPVVQHAASLLTLEVLKALSSLAIPTLVGRVCEFDALTLTSTLHPVLQRPDCPACRKRGRPPRPGPGIEGLRAQVGQATSLRDAAPRLVSGHSGVVRSLRRVPKDPGEPLAPFVYRAELANHRFAASEDEPFTVCSGKGMTEQDARLGALGEACERYSAASWDRSLVRVGRRAELDGPSLDPRDLVLYADDQYADLPYAPWREASAIGWVEATDLLAGSGVLVPAIGVFLDYEVQDRREYLCPVTSNGLAAGATLAAAVLAAALEVIERDAFVISWLNRLPGRRIDPLTVPDSELVALVRAYRRRGVETELYELSTDLPVRVVAAVGVQLEGSGPSAVVGLGADLEGAAAARKAALEVGQVRPALQARLRDPASQERLAALVAEPMRVTALDDHDLLYAHPAMLGALDLWRSLPAEPLVPDPRPVPALAGDRLALLGHDLAERGTPLLYRDLTSAELGALGIHAARAILPGFQPIHFGAREARLGGSRLYQLPVRLGHRATPATAAELNPMPHPLA